MAGIYIVMKHWPHETSFTFAVRKKGLRSIALKPKLYRLRYWILGALTGGRRAYSSQFIHIKIYLKTHYLNVMFQRDVLFPLFSFICFSFHGAGQYLIFATLFSSADKCVSAICVFTVVSSEGFSENKQTKIQLWPDFRVSLIYQKWGDLQYQGGIWFRFPNFIEGLHPYLVMLIRNAYVIKKTLTPLTFWCSHPIKLIFKDQ